jgi:ABC-type Na+ efflux pump, permease component
MRLGYVWAVFSKEWRDLLSNRLLLGAVAFPALVFAAIPTGLVAFIQARDLDPEQLGQIQQYIANFPNVPAKLAAQAFIVTNFMAYFLLIPAMVPMAIATQSVIGEKVARSLEPQLATPLEVSELLAGKTIAAALPAVTATWLVFIGYGYVNGLIADPRLTRFVFSDVWIVAMLTLVPLICLLSVLLGIVISSRVNDPRTAQQIGGFVVIPIIAIAVAHVAPLQVHLHADDDLRRPHVDEVADDAHAAGAGQLHDRRDVRHGVAHVGHEGVPRHGEAVERPRARLLHPLDLLRAAHVAERRRREPVGPTARAARDHEPVLGRGLPERRRPHVGREVDELLGRQLRRRLVDDRCFVTHRVTRPS